MLRARVVVRTSNTKVSLPSFDSQIFFFPPVQHDYFSSFNQSSHWFVALSSSLLPSFRNLPMNDENIIYPDVVLMLTCMSLLVKCTIHPCFRTLEPFLLVCFTDTTILCNGMLLLIVGVNCGGSPSDVEGLAGSNSSWLLRLADSVSFSMSSCSSNGISLVRSISDKLSEIALESVE